MTLFAFHSSIWAIWGGANVNFSHFVPGRKQRRKSPCFYVLVKWFRIPFALFHYLTNFTASKLRKFELFSELIYIFEHQKPKKNKKKWSWKEYNYYQTNRRYKTCVIKCINHLFPGIGLYCRRLLMSFNQLYYRVHKMTQCILSQKQIYI